MTAPLNQIWSGALEDAHKTDVRTQFASLCYRVKKGRVEVLLVTSRGSGRWILPKGWPMPGVAPTVAAATEAWEEAGVKGRVYERPVGLYAYNKDVEDGEALACMVVTYAIRVDKLAREFPERKERERKWVSRKRAAKMVAEPALADMLRGFDPRHLSK